MSLDSNNQWVVPSGDRGVGQQCGFLPVAVGHGDCQATAGPYQVAVYMLEAMRDVLVINISEVGLCAVVATVMVVFG